MHSHPHHGKSRPHLHLISIQSTYTSQSKRILKHLVDCRCRPASDLLSCLVVPGVRPAEGCGGRTASYSSETHRFVHFSPCLHCALRASQGIDSPSTATATRQQQIDDGWHNAICDYMHHHDAIGSLSSGLLCRVRQLLVVRCPDRPQERCHVHVPVEPVHMGGLIILAWQ